jgi:hypothetical protein
MQPCSNLVVPLISRPLMGNLIRVIMSYNHQLGPSQLTRAEGTRRTQSILVISVLALPGPYS